MSDHPDEPVKFTMEITKKFKDALTRQANEAVRIYSRPSHETLNSKSEFNHPPLHRVVVEKEKKSVKQKFSFTYRTENFNPRIWPIFRIKAVNRRSSLESAMLLL